MLTSEELTNIRSAAKNELVSKGLLAHANEVAGINQNMDELHEVMLYNFALDNYVLGSSLNALLECQIQDIYSRLRELRDVA